MKKLLILALVVVPVALFAQSSPNWPTGYNPSAAEWNAEWASKADITSGSCTGCTLTSPTITNPTITGGTITGLTSPLLPVSGGTGVANSNTKTITLGGSYATVGGNLLFNLSGDTTLTLPTSGTFLSNVLVDGKILLGNGSNVATAVTPSGDATMTNAGAITVGKVNGVTYPVTPGANTVPLRTSVNTMTYTATSQMPGTTTNDNASAGNIGEVLTNTASGVSITNNSAVDVTTVALTAGDWDCRARCTITFAGASTNTAFDCGISPTANTLPTVGDNNRTELGVSIPASSVNTLLVGPTRVSLSAGATWRSVAYILTNTGTTVSSTMTCRRAR